jgi:hypothetical protein
MHTFFSLSYPRVARARAFLARMDYIFSVCFGLEACVLLHILKIFFFDS